MFTLKLSGMLDDKVHVRLQHIQDYLIGLVLFLLINTGVPSAFYSVCFLWTNLPTEICYNILTLSNKSLACRSFSA